MLFKLLIVLLILLVPAALIYFFVIKHSANTPLSKNPTVSPINPAMVTKLQNKKTSAFTFYNSKQSTPSGSLQLTESLSSVLMEATLNNTSSSQIGYIQQGNCNSQGKLLFPLVSFKMGRSTTLIPIPFEELVKQFPLSVKTYASSNNIKSYSSCADLKI